jgi:xylem cysteine proteinase
VKNSRHTLPAKVTLERDSDAGKVVAFVGALTLALLAYQHVMSATADANEMLAVWSSWKSQYGVTYGSTQEDALRFKVFQDNYNHIQQFNSEGHTYWLGLNQFSAMTGEEFKAYTACQGDTGKGFGDEYCPSAVNCPTLADTSLTAWNWTAKGAVTGVKNQGDCGSCWAFSTTGSLEGLYYLNKTLLVSMSEQQLVDCASTCYGCDGCWPATAMTYTASEGIEPEKLYPYTGVQGTCQYKSIAAITVNSGYQCIAQKAQGQLMTALTWQPVSIAVEADQAAWQSYAGGVVAKNCGDTLDHAVLLVGYDATSDSWIVKNSWGTTWGEAGYIRIGTSTSENQGYGVCGIYRCPNVPTA